MAGNARFHDKLHRKSHHTLPTNGYPDSGLDPIASPAEPFQGDFVINGTLSSNSGIQFLSSNIPGNFECENLKVRTYTYTNFISGDGTETIVSDGALTGHGNYTMTMDFRNGIYAQSPLFVATNVLSSLSAIYSPTAGFNNLSVSNNLSVGGNLLVTGNLSALGDISVIETNIAATSSLSVFNTGSSTAFIVTQMGGTPIAEFSNGANDVLKINSNSVNVSGGLNVTGNVISPNITDLSSTSGNWNRSFNSLTSTSGNWNSVYSSVNSTSGNWNQSYTNLNSNSANWNNTFNTTNNLSTNWNSAYTGLTSTSSNWNSVYSSVNSASGNWNQSYTNLNSNSANWNNTFNTTNSLSSNWNSSYTGLTSTSSNWNNAYTAVISKSANWNSVYNTVSSTSADWLSGNSNVDFVSRTGNFTNSISTQDAHINSLYVSASALTANNDITLALTSPTYIFMDTNGVQRNIELPSVNSAQKGLTFIVKNTSTNNIDIHLHYNGGLAQTPVAIIIKDTYKQVIATGQTNSWLVL